MTTLVRMNGLKGYVLFSVSCIFLAGMLLVGCTAPGGTGSSKRTLFALQDTVGEARLSVFMELQEPDGPDLWVKADKLEVYADETWYPISLARTEIATKEIEEVDQIIVGRGGVPSGRYQRLRLTLDKAALEREGKRIFLALDDPVIELVFPAQLTLTKGDSTSLFLNWDAAASLRDSALLVPQMTATSQSIPLTTDLAYVACPDIDTLYVIRTDQNQVCGSIGMAGGPSRISVNVDTNRLYVLTPEDSSIKILELTSNRQVDVVRIPMATKATDMVVGPEGEWAYILDEQGDQLLRLNLITGVLSERVRLGARPQEVIYVRDQNLLAVSSAYDQKVVFLEPTSLNLVKTIATRGRPDGILVLDDSLYIAESSTNTVTVYDLVSGKSRARLNVGSQPRRFIYNNNHVYVANYGGGSISILLPGQLNVSRQIRLGGKPWEMDIYASRQWLYVCDAAGEGLFVIDLSSNRLVRTIELAAASLGLAVVE